MTSWRTVIHNVPQTAADARRLGISTVAAECWAMARYYHTAAIMAERASLPLEEVKAGLMECRRKGLLRHAWHHRPADRQVKWYRPDLVPPAPLTRREQRLRYLAHEKRVLLDDAEEEWWPDE